MKKAIINYLNKPAGIVAERAAAVSSNLYTAAIFTTPPVTKVNLDAQTVIVNNAVTAAIGNDRQLLAVVRNEKKVLAIMLRQLAEYVNTVVQDGDESKLLLSGFAISKTPVKNQLPGAIDKIKATYTDVQGKIDLSWSLSQNARYYQVYMSADNGETWTIFNTVFSRKLLVDRLTSGQRYQFKIVPVGLLGEGPVSDVASQMCA